MFVRSKEFDKNKLPGKMEIGLALGSVVAVFAARAAIVVVVIGAAYAVGATRVVCAACDACGRQRAHIKHANQGGDAPGHAVRTQPARRARSPAA